MARTDAKNLTSLLEGLDYRFTSGSDIRVTGISADSRQISPGSVFVAIHGYETDGHYYITDALDAGAVAVVYEDSRFANDIPEDVPGIVVPDSRRACAVLADRFWEHPSGDMTIVAVTGTNGKTTCVHLIDAIFREAGYTTGTVGTLGSVVDGDQAPADRTTPDAVGLQERLAEMAQAGVTHAAMEVTSHALDLDRAFATSFRAAVFTNLSRDHLDWHETMGGYFASKARLFTDYVRFTDRMDGIINIDDPWGPKLAEAAECPVTTCAIDRDADITASDVSLSAKRTTFTLHTPSGQAKVDLQLLGLFNVYNAICAAGCCHALDIPTRQIADGLHAAKPVLGRMERVQAGQDFAVLVDYAHTPQALENVLRACRALDVGRLICVFGCGGDRDRTKRPRMGRIAAQLSDIAIVTSDNPRSEDPMEIISQIQAGMAPGEYQTEPDRRSAIRQACELAGDGDIVLIAGKGHETYQEFADGRINFDDRRVAREVLKELSKGSTRRS